MDTYAYMCRTGEVWARVPPEMWKKRVRIERDRGSKPSSPYH